MINGVSPTKSLIFYLWKPIIILMIFVCKSKQVIIFALFSICCTCTYASIPYKRIDHNIMYQWIRAGWSTWTSSPALFRALHRISIHDQVYSAGVCSTHQGGKEARSQSLKFILSYHIISFLQRILLDQICKLRPKLGLKWPRLCIMIQWCRPPGCCWRHWTWASNLQGA